MASLSCCSSNGKKPKLIVFDLDYTLWPFYVDAHLCPPFQKNKYGRVVDARGRSSNPYPEVSEVLKQLHNEGYLLGIASRSTDPGSANQLLTLYDWDKYFTYKEIYPRIKDQHFAQIKTDSGLEYSDMLFFDDEEYNRPPMRKIGVLMIMVPNGVDKQLIKKGLEEYSARG